MKIVLELLDQTSSVRKITVRHDIVIGRGSECNLRLSAPQVSRRHCFLRVGRDGISITDLDSSNGTWVNGARIPAGTRRELTDGAQLSLGPVRFLLHVRPEAGSDAPAANAFHAALPGNAAEDSTCAHPGPVTATSGNASLQTLAAYPQPTWQADDSRAEIIELGRQLTADTSSHNDQTILNPQLATPRSAKDRLDSATTSPDLNLAALGALENADVLDPNVLAGKFPPDRPMWSRDAAQLPESAPADIADHYQNPDNAHDFDDFYDIAALEDDQPGDDQPGDDQPGDDQPGDDFPGVDHVPAPENNNAEPDQKDDDFGPELSAFLQGL